MARWKWTLKKTVLLSFSNSARNVEIENEEKIEKADLVKKKLELIDPDL